ncbi:hypothetical protein Pyn_32454 [Prunus yedoensis var. nudiflora]|uniref:Uncharacterized protein n=1 Tax=Prunus yedoensis var. nudiflora TaxID=2094558 RepID=A0A314ZNE5_PRUYE|nr:hypothetical protein Pyn_32454 [Prunus yedoensis var. nudiflora]
MEWFVGRDCDGSPGWLKLRSEVGEFVAAGGEGGGKNDSALVVEAEAVRNGLATGIQRG